VKCVYVALYKDSKSHLGNTRSRHCGMYKITSLSILHHGKNHRLYILPNIIKVIKSRGMKDIYIEDEEGVRGASR
jgi:hypothetical protein